MVTVQLDKNIFLEKINIASRFVSTKISSLNIIQGVCLKGENNVLHIYSTNLNQYYHAVIEAEIKNSFLVVFEPKKVIDFLTLIPKNKINLQIEENKILITQDQIKGEFPLYKEKDFPFPPVIDKKDQRLKTDFLKNNLPLVLFATSNDDSRPVLTGVNFITSDEEILIVSTDGFRLSLLKTKKDINFPSIIVPANFLSDFLNLIKNEKEIGFSFSEKEKMIQFKLANDNFYTRIIEGDFPPFEKVIPTQKNTTIEVDRKEFLRNVRLVSVFSREFSNILVLKIKENKLVFFPKTDGEEKEITTQEAKIEGEEIKIAFNLKFLLDLLNHLSSDEIIIEFLRPDSPAVFKEKNNPNFLHIIMPIRIQE
ncbi:MAG: DNA polymerase III subunit beta [Microgenomates group bacterium]